MAKLGKVIGVLTISILILNFGPNYMGRAQSESYTIEVDETSRTVYSGEDAVFTWTLENKDPIKIFEFFPSANEDRNDFVPESIILNPCEKGIVIQTFNTTGLNSSFVNGISITWIVRLCGPLSILENPSDPSQVCSGRLEVIILENVTIDNKNKIINDKNKTINISNENPNNDLSNMNYLPFSLIGIIIIIAIFISYYEFQRRRQSEF
jgi:hypothetical protein